MPWVIVYFEEFKTITEARKREYAIKKMKSRKYIESLISKDRRAEQSIPISNREGHWFESNPGHTLNS